MPGFFLLLFVGVRIKVQDREREPADRMERRGRLVTINFLPPTLFFLSFIPTLIE